MNLKTLLLGHHDDHSIPRIGSALDRMEAGSRLYTTRSATREDMVTLWELMKGQELEADHFVQGSVTAPAVSPTPRSTCRAPLIRPWKCLNLTQHLLGVKTA